MRLKFSIVIFVIVGLTGCSIIPGMHMSQFSNESSVEMPFKENNTSILKKLNIQTITAQLIIDIEKDFNNRSLGENNVANHYFDYRIGSKTENSTPIKKIYRQYLVGPRDVLNITV